jgi:hypothetical protein
VIASWSAVHRSDCPRVAVVDVIWGHGEPGWRGPDRCYQAALEQLNGTDAAAVSLMTRLDADELDDLGGLPKQMH